MAQPPVSWSSAYTAAVEGDAPVAPQHRRGQLTARPQPAAEAGPIGLVPLGVVAERDTLALVPSSYRADRPAPLMIVLHGAGGGARSALGLLQAVAADTGAILLAPSSRDRTWDMIVGSLGPDVAVIDRSLDAAFDRWSLDPARISIAGFSDGASYALTLGLANGALFGNILAFSPGFTTSPAIEGRPRVFVSHGVSDRVLPIGACSRRIVPELRSSGYDVRYVEFPGGHTIPAAVARGALEWLGLVPAAP